MGPCLFRHGNRIEYSRHETGIPASMGPCLFRHGNALKIRGVDGDIFAASMGPCLFRHGNYERAHVNLCCA